MLESMRNHAQSWIAKVILGGVALSFVLWGVGDYFLGGQVQPVAEVDGSPIGQTEFVQAYERQLNNYRRMLGSNFSKELVRSLGLKDNTLQTMINRRLMLDEANKLGLTAPESMVIASVRQEAAFQSAGNFDPQRYRILTRNMGYATPQDYEQDLKVNLLIDMLQKTIVDSARVSEQEVREQYERDYEKRVLAAVVVEPASLEKDITIDHDKALAWYEAHKDQYMSPLRVRLKLVDIDPLDMAKDLAVSKADLDKAYEENLQQYTRPEQRHARHILIKVSPDASEGVRKAAREKIEAALKRVRSGEDFAKVAKEVSQDSSAKQGGDLGWFAQGAMVPQFDAQVFSMQPGEISDVVETQFGFHIIKLEGVKPREVLPLEKVKAELEAEIRRRMGADEAYQLSQDLDDALGMEDSLSAAAESVGLNVREIGPISQNEAFAEKALSDPAIRNQVFSARPGDPIEIHETNDGHFIAFEIVERVQPQVLPFEKVAKRATDDARRDAARNKARELAEKILKAANGKNADELAQQFSLPKFISKPLRANGSGDQAPWLTRSVLDAAFRTAKGQWLTSVQQVPDGLAVVQVQDVIPASEEEFQKQQDSIRQQVKKSKGAVRFARWMDSVREQHEIIVHPEVIERF